MLRYADVDLGYETYTTLTAVECSSWAGKKLILDSAFLTTIFDCRMDGVPPRPVQADERNTTTS